jgi:FkbM family methyltransferase
MSETLTSYAQTEEDRLVWEFFGRKRDGFFVEVGANDPIFLSQSYLLEQNGWKGILVEPQEACCRKLREHRPHSQVWQAACSSPEKRGEAIFHIASDSVNSGMQPNESDPEVVYVGTETVKVVTLDDILTASGEPSVDFLSVDVEGFEIDVLDGLDFSKRGPKLLIIEDHVHNLDKHRYLKGRGYELVFRTGCNNWYVPQGTPFPFTTWIVRWKLLRKMYLGLAWRQWKLRRKQQHT